MLCSSSNISKVSSTCRPSGTIKYHSHSKLSGYFFDSPTFGVPISKVSSSVAFRTLLYRLDEAKTKVKSHPIIFVPYPSDNAMTSSDLYASPVGEGEGEGWQVRLVHTL